MSKAKESAAKGSLSHVPKNEKYPSLLVWGTSFGIKAFQCSWGSIPASDNSGHKGSVNRFLQVKLHNDIVSVRRGNGPHPGGRCIYYWSCIRVLWYIDDKTDRLWIVLLFINTQQRPYILTACTGHIATHLHFPFTPLEGEE